MDDTSTISLVLAGDRSAFVSLMEHYMHMVHTVSYRVLRNELDAEEATQDTFVKTYQQLAEFKGEGKFSTWLYSIAYRTAITALRRRKRTTGSIDELSEAGKEPTASFMEPLDERAAILDKALRTLPPEDAAVMTMFYLEELRVEEIVTVTGMSASNVKVKLHRCRKRLFEVLHRQLKDETWTLVTSA